MREHEQFSKERASLKRISKPITTLYFFFSLLSMGDKDDCISYNSSHLTGYSKEAAIYMQMVYKINNTSLLEFWINGQMHGYISTGMESQRFLGELRRNLWCMGVNHIDLTDEVWRQRLTWISPRTSHFRK